ncbi:hypothetical protein D3C76_743250 [compost metagenome]
MDGLHVVALLDRQRRAQQQFGHAQYAVHRRADLMADLGQELGLGVDLGVAGRQRTTGAEALFTDPAQALADRQIEQQAAETGEAQKYEQQPLCRRPGQAEEGRKHHQAANVEGQHRQGEQPCWRIALVPVVAGNQQHAQRAQGEQRIGHQVERQGIDEQQQQAKDPDQDHFCLQQAAQAWVPTGAEEAQGEGQAGQACKQGGQVGGWCLRRVPEAPPGPAEVEQDQGAEQHQAVIDGKAQAGAGARIGKADEVVQHQHQQAAEQQAEQQGLALIGGNLSGRLQADARTQLMLGNQAQVNIQRMRAARQGQLVVAAAHGGVAAFGGAAVVYVLDQLVAVQGIKIKTGQVRREDPQQLFVLPGFQAIVQPQRLVWRCGIELVQLNRAELITVAIGTYIAELQVGLFVEQNRPATALFG